MKISILTLCIAVAAGTIPAASVLRAKPVQIAQAETRTPTAQTILVQQVQIALIRLGYDPGPADGLIGDRTTRSVRAFQQQAGLPVDGRVTPTLYGILRDAIDTPPATVASEAPPPPATTTATVADPPLRAGGRADPVTPNAAAAAGATFVNSLWTITDPDGATLTLRLMPDGKISDVESPLYWKWQLRGEEIQINYDNKLGGWVERRGRIVSANELRGEAVSSREREWTWRARRIDTRK